MSFDINTLVRDNIKKLKPYSSARDEFHGSASVFLDANENPFPTGYNRYPDPRHGALKKKICEIKKVNSDQIFTGNGSDEAIDLVFRIFCEPGKDNAIIPQPTYGMFAVSAQIHDVEVRNVSLNQDFDIEPEIILKEYNQNTKLLFLCSPNNPSGNLLSREKVIEVLKTFKGMVVIDEAYIDFSNSPSYVDLLGKFENLIVLQTLSKAWGLAGLRVGLAFGNKEVINLLDKVKAPYNLSSFAQQHALESLQNEGGKNRWVEEIISQRSFLKDQLGKIRKVEKVYPSDANFLLVKVEDAAKLYNHLVGKGIVVRDRSSVALCGNCLRITVGTAAENQLLINTLIAYEKSTVS